MDAERMLFLGFWGIVGLCVGSFLSVVVARVPAGQSIVRPRSACPSCGRTLAPRDLVPLLSWLLLRGRCRGCGSGIPATYPLLELLTGVSWGFAYWRFDRSWSFAFAAALSSLLIAVAVVQVRQRQIPDKILAGGLVVTGPLALFTGLTPWVEALVGTVVCGGLIFLIGGRYQHRLAVAGTPKLFALLGLVLGWRLGLMVLLFSLLAGGILTLWGRGRWLPMGTVIAAAAVAAFYGGDQLLALFSRP